MADNTTAHGDAPAQKGQQGGLLKWTTSMPSDVMSMLNPFSSDEADKDSKAEKKEKDGDAQANKRTSMFASFMPSALLGGDSTAKDDEDRDKEDDMTMFAEPETRTNSDDGSREGSIFDDAGRQKTKKSKCPRSSYSICHPAPASTTRQRLHRRPRSMMQLHKLSADRRPRPAFEVIPSANFSVRLTKAITKVFKAKHGLCPNDLVVLRAEKYAAAEDEGNEEQDERDIIALICKGRPGDAASAGGKTRMCLPGGQEWEAYPTLNGGYEFFSTDAHGLGLTVRWVMKKGKDGTKPTDPLKRKFNFSTISPNTRRHPVIATIGRTGLDINDTYKMPDANAATPLSTPKQNATILADAMEDEEAPSQQQEVCEMDPRLREIIVMTGIWVAFKEGWSPFYKYDDKDKEASLAVQRSPSLQPHSPAKSATFSLGGASPVSTPPGSPIHAPIQKRSSIRSIGSGIVRTGSLLRRTSADNHNRRSAASVPEEADIDSTFEALQQQHLQQQQQQQQQRTSRSRANSNSTVLVHRAASNRRRKNEAVWRPDLLTAQQEAVNEETSPSPQGRRGSGRKGSLTAQPILPPSNSTQSGEHTEREEEEDGDGAAVATPTKRRSTTNGTAAATQVLGEKRESSATTATASSRGSPAKVAVTGDGKGRVKERRVKSGWRRILCGSGQDI